MQFVIWNGVVQQGMNGHADIRRRTSLSLVITHQDDMLMAVVCSLSFVSIHNSYSLLCLFSANQLEKPSNGKRK